MRTLATQASSIYENVVWAAPAGNLFIRTGVDIRIVSREGATVVSRRLESNNEPYWFLFAAPNRDTFAATNLGGEYAVFKGTDLTPMAGPCRSGNGRLNSITEKYVALTSEPAIRSLYGRRIEVRDFCGGVVWSHEWEGRPAYPKLLTADRVLLLGTEAHIELISRDRSEWKLSWGKRNDVPRGYAKASVDGSVIGVLLRHFAGGSRIFDIPEKLVGATLVLLEGQSGRIIAKLPIRFPAQTFDFAISRDGRAVATLTDGDLMVAEINKSSEKQ